MAVATRLVAAVLLAAAGVHLPAAAAVTVHRVESLLVDHGARLRAFLVRPSPVLPALLLVMVRPLARPRTVRPALLLVMVRPLVLRPATVPRRVNLALLPIRPRALRLVAGYLLATLLPACRLDSPVHLLDLPVMDLRVVLLLVACLLVPEVQAVATAPEVREVTARPEANHPLAGVPRGPVRRGVASVRPAVALVPPAATGRPAVARPASVVLMRPPAFRRPLPAPPAAGRRWRP